LIPSDENGYDPVVRIEDHPMKRMSIAGLALTLLLSFPVYSADAVNELKLDEKQIVHAIHGERLSKEFIHAKAVITGQPTGMTVAVLSYVIVEKMKNTNNFEWKTFNNDSGYRKSVVGYGLKSTRKDEPDKSCLFLFNYTPGDTSSEFNFVKCGGQSLDAASVMILLGILTADGEGTDVPTDK
jgi:hypothetical protein